MKIFQFKYARLVYGSFLLILGTTLFVIPVLPFGYVFLFAGGYLLADRIPAFRKLKRWLKKRDKKGRLDDAEEQISAFFGEPTDDRTQQQQD